MNESEEPKRDSAVDQLAETMPRLLHVLADKSAPSLCGAFDREGEPITPLDEGYLHSVTAVVPSEAVDVSVDLDSTDRSRPLLERKLTDAQYEIADKAGVCRVCFRLAALERCYPEEPHRLGEPELKAFVQSWLAQQVFSHLHARNPSDVSMVFMCIMLAPPMPEDFAEKVGLIYEFMDAAQPRAVNGNPTFFSHRLMHVDDWKRVLPVIQAEEARRAEIEIP